MDPRLAASVDRAEITDVVHRYCRGIDRRDFDIVRACFHPDATDRHGAEPRSLDDFVAWVDRLTARYRMTQHLIASVVVDLAGDVAAVESNGVAVHRSDDPSPHLNLVTGFRYLDRFERRDGHGQSPNARVSHPGHFRLPPINGGTRRPTMSPAAETVTTRCMPSSGAWAPTSGWGDHG